MKERLATLISGSGTTMQEIIKASQSGEVNIDIACVISSDEAAGGIEKARKLGIPEKDIVVVNPKDEKFGEEIVKILKEHDATVVTQNGWLPFTPEIVIEEFPNAIFNQHPGPVPEFGGKGMYGRRVHAARLLFVRMTKRDFWTEVISQKVGRNYDEGVVVKSARVDIFPGDTVEDLQARALSIEHRVQIEMLKDFVNGKIKEVSPRESLVKPGEEVTLSLVKRMAAILYPHG